MFNRIELIGRLTRDPEYKELSNTPLVNFSVATNEVWTNKEGQKQERTEFFECTLFGKAASTFAKHTTKGQLVFVSGRMRFDKTEDKRVFPKVQVEEFRFLSKKEGPAASGTTEPSDLINDAWF